ncbi:MAG: hypothetical protein V7K48_15000 [Nostoc sp.]|uniref:hypothetical protein n=1 Tax=Nostoc sp. TaxID=1180 RepID=UPI002FF78670
MSDSSLPEAVPTRRPREAALASLVYDTLLAFERHPKQAGHFISWISFRLMLD